VTESFFDTSTWGKIRGPSLKGRGFYVLSSKAVKVIMRNLSPISREAAVES